MILFRKSPKPEKSGKKPRIWELGGTAKDLAILERTRDKPEESGDYIPADITVMFFFLFIYSFNIGKFNPLLAIIPNLEIKRKDC